MRRLVLVCLFGLAACQPAPPVPIPVEVTSTPPGAACAADRDGVHLGDVALTPGQLVVPAMKGTVSVTCRKPGYVTATQQWTPAYSPDVGYVGPGAVVVLAIALAGPPRPKSDWHYPAEFHVELLPVGAPGTPLPLSGLRLQ